jgi:hypothetical protein
MPGEKTGSRFTAKITVDALLIDVELTGCVVVKLVCFIRHGVVAQKPTPPTPVKPERQSDPSNQTD